MNKLKVGDKFEFEYPFYYSTEETSFMDIGCRKTEHYDPESEEYSITWRAHQMGKVQFEILGIAEMVGKYSNRIVIKRRYTWPCGRITESSRVKVITELRLNKFIQANSAFPCEYKLNEQFREPKVYESDENTPF